MIKQFKAPNVITLIILVLLSLSSACGSPSTFEVQEVSPASLEPDSPIPNPTQEVILTISGAITMKNAGESLVFDMENLEKLRVVKYTVIDPWLDEQITYTGILMSDLLKVAGTSTSATTVNIHALDQYQVDIPITELEEWPILLATQSNGQYMPIEHNGPIRIIYPYDSYPKLSVAKNMSIWNIDRITVK